MAWGSKWRDQGGRKGCDFQQALATDEAACHGARGTAGANGAQCRNKAPNTKETEAPAAKSASSRTKAVSPPASTTEPGPPAAKAIKQLKVSRAEMQQAFSGEPFRVSFQAATSVRGQPRVMGQTPDGLATIELIGPPSGLISASCLVGLPNDSPEALP